VILAAGLGSRLGGTPKALFPLADEPLASRAAHALAAGGFDAITLITGHGADEVERFWAQARLPLEATFVFNEHYADMNNFQTVAVACTSCRPGDLLIINSDIVFRKDVAQDLVAVGGDLGLAVEEAPTDEEALKVRVEDGHVTELGKHLDPAVSFGEFIGMSVLSHAGREAYVVAAAAARDAGETNLYYEDIYSRICTTLDSRMSAVPQEAWAEIDAPEDVPRAEAVAALQDAARA
jgi:choline kinase